MTKVYAVFVDVDGVIFSPWQYNINYMVPVDYHGLIQNFDNNALNNMNRMIELIQMRTGVQVIIILSSNWRLLGTVYELKELFKMHKFSNYIVDKTPHIGDNNRDLEIYTWLEVNKCKYTVLNYVIIDDNDFNLSKRFGRRFIKCDPEKLFDNDTLNIALTNILDKRLHNEKYWYTGLFVDHEPTNKFLLIIFTNLIMLWLIAIFLILKI